MQNSDHSYAEQNADRLRLLPGVHHIVSAGCSQPLPHAVPSIWHEQGCLVFNYDPANVERLLADCPLLALINLWSPNATIHGRALFDLVRGIPCKKLDLYIPRGAAPISVFLLAATRAIEDMGLECSMVNNGGSASIFIGGWEFHITNGDAPIEIKIMSHHIGTCGIYRNHAGDICASSAGLLALWFGALVLDPAATLTADEATQLVDDFDLHMPIAMPGMDQPAAWVEGGTTIGRAVYVEGLRLDVGCYCGMAASRLLHFRYY